MTYRFGNKVVIEPQGPDRCELCGRVKELRPYGPNGANVCFDCGMKDEPEAKRQFDKVLDDGEQT